MWQIVVALYCEYNLTKSNRSAVLTIAHACFWSLVLLYPMLGWQFPSLDLGVQPTRAENSTYEQGTRTKAQSLQKLVEWEKNRRCFARKWKMKCHSLPQWSSKFLASSSQHTPIISCFSGRGGTSDLLRVSSVFQATFLQTSVDAILPSVVTHASLQTKIHPHTRNTPLPHLKCDPWIPLLVRWGFQSPGEEEAVPKSLSILLYPEFLVRHSPKSHISKSISSALLSSALKIYESCMLEMGVIIMLLTVVA